MVSVSAAAAPAVGAPPVPVSKARADHLSAVLARVAQPAVVGASTRAQAGAAGTPATGPGSLLRADSARLLVEVRVGRADPGTLAALAAAGAKATFVSAANHEVTAAVKPADLVRVGKVSGVEYVGQIYTPMVARTGRHPSAVPAAAPLACSPTVSEGDAVLNADRARSKLGIDGAGVTVGVLSDSFAQTVAPTSAAGDTATGDLPGPTNPCGHTTPVNVLDDSAPPPNVDEGRAMAQTVHDLAPGANLAFATAFAGEDQFAANIQALATAGAKVIVDDVTYFDEPMYQDGVVSNAVSAVTDAGVAYFSSAANENMVISGHNVGSYEATNGYRPTPCPTVLSAYPDCHNFSTTGTDNTYGMTVAPGGVVNIDLQWAQPLFNVTSDLDAYLISSTGTILASSVDDNRMSEHPFELLQWPNTGPAAQAVRLVIARFSGPNPRFKFVHMDNGSSGITSVEYPTSAVGDVVGPTIFGHNGAATAGSVAAVPFDDANTPEYYTSHGPVTLLFGPVNGMTPAAPISPQVLAKPDFAATDCVRNTFFGELDGTTRRFCGTSDAAPHAAAVAALLRQHDPTLTPAQVQNTLATTASPVVNGSAVSTGAGLLNAYPAGNTTTTLAPSTIVAGPGHSVTFTATVTRTGVTPTGTVTFTDAGTTLAALPLDGGQATMSTSTLTGGNHHIVATYSGDADNNSSAAATNVAIDATAPVATVSAPASLFQVSRTITTRYSATDSPSGVASYDVRYRVAAWNAPFGSYVAPASWQHVTVAARSLTGTPGHEYCFSVRARDHAGNTSAWSRDRCAVLPLDDRSLAAATSGWTRATSSVSYQSTLTRTASLGAKLLLANAHLDRVALVVVECTSCGNVGIYLNGVLWRTVSTHATSTRYKVILIQPPFSLRTTTIVLRNASSGKQLIVDGLGIART